MQQVLGVQAGNQQLVLAAAAAAVRSSTEATTQVHNEAMRVIREAGEPSRGAMLHHTSEAGASFRGRSSGPHE